VHKAGGGDKPEVVVSLPSAGTPLKKTKQTEMQLRIKISERFNTTFR